MLFFFFFLGFCSEQSDVGAENKKKKDNNSRSIFLIYVFANVLISNMMHKVECVFQPDELSLSRGERRQQRTESGGRNWEEGGKGGGVFNMGKVYVYLKE